MSVLSDYTAEEQRLLLTSVRAAGVAVSAASPGRGHETASEGFAAASYVLESEGEFLDNTLINSLQFELKRMTQDGYKFASFTDMAETAGAETDAMKTLADAAALLDAKSTPYEAKGFKQFLMNIANRTAEAGKEGGNWLGFGAVQVNDAEREALRQIAQVLGV